MLDNVSLRCPLQNSDYKCYIISNYCFVSGNFSVIIKKYFKINMYSLVLKLNHSFRIVFDSIRFLILLSSVLLENVFIIGAN